MLSRVAESIYWMARYMERAENIARYIDVNLHLNLDIPLDLSDQWKALVRVTGDDEWFDENYGSPSEENVIRFLTLDANYSSSIISCMKAARENARSVREIISSEMWEQINTLYLYVSEMAKNDGKLDSPYAFFKRVRMSSCLFSGQMDATMSHDEGWHFSRIGQMLERADKTSRILDIKYFILLPSVNDIGTPFDNILWSALLHSASAFEMYRRKWRRIDHKKVANFLILSPDFPRSIFHCINQADKSLHAISGSPEGAFINAAEKAIGQLHSNLAYTTIEDILNNGLHEYLDSMQTQFNKIGSSINGLYFVTDSGSQFQTQTQTML